MGASSAGGGASGRDEERTGSAEAKIKAAEQGPTAMKLGIHSSSWLDAPDLAETFAVVKAKAQ